jgi:type VI secretion system protein ImpL
MSWWRGRIARRRGPCVLLLGPPGAGKTAIVEAALQAGAPAPRQAARRNEQAAWCDLGTGVIVDVPGMTAFPAPGSRLGPWEQLLRKLRRLRPRRPLDAIILALPANLFYAPGQDDDRADLAAAIRERFALIQGLLGFTLPVYVVLSKTDEIPGFATFIATLTDEQRRQMLGWSNPHATDEKFSPSWVDEGLDSLHDAVVRTRVERFASSTHIQDSRDLFLFTRALREMVAPLRAMLDDVFRPSLYREAFACRGLYLCGRGADDGSSIAFVRDLIADKVFAERGLATPLPEVVKDRKRSALAAQVVCALLVIAFGLASYWSYLRLRRAETELEALLTRAEQVAAERNRATANGRPLNARYRLDQSRRLLDEQLQAVNSDRFSWGAYQLNPLVSQTLTRLFSSIVLDDFRVALEDKARRWLAAAERAFDDPAPSGPNFQDRARYRRLARFAQEYQPLIDGFRRYEELRLNEGSRTIASLAAVSESLDGRPLGMQALGRPYARALRRANAAPVDCSVFEDPATGDGLVPRVAAELVDEFSAWSFDEENPLRSAAREFIDEWLLISSGEGAPRDLASLMTAASTLATSAAAWSTLDTAITDQPVALFQQAPFMRLAADSGVCRGLLWPDLGDRVDDVDRLKDQFRDHVLALEVDPFGPLFDDDDAGLMLSEPVAAFNQDLDALKAQSFWSPAFIMSEDDGWSGLPRAATWRLEDLDAAVRTANAFSDFRGSAFPSVDDASRSTLLDLVALEVAQLVGARLQRTAITGAELPGDSSDLPEYLKLTGSTVAKLTPLAPLLGRSVAGEDVLSTLDAQSRAALNAIDREASRQYPWLFAWPRRQATADGLFDRWSAIRARSAAAEAGKLWEAAVDEQRDAVIRYAAAARPFAAYLLARRQMAEPTLRWTRISRDVASYELKTADNGLGAIDAFMRTGVPALVPANACLAGPVASTRAVGEYFAPIRNELAREGERQCRMQVQRAYASIAQAFRENLQGRFPFVDASSPSFAARVKDAQSRPEATPAHVKAVIDRYRSVDGPAVTQFLASWRACSHDPALAFLQALDNTGTLLASAADPALKTPTIVLDVMPEFRLAANPGSGGDHVAAWRLDVGSRSVGEPIGAPVTPLPWTYGDKVALEIRFARDSPNVPAPGAGVPAAGSGGDTRTVHFDFTGNWAIFQLLLARRIPNDADVLLLRDAAPTVLAIDIPVQADPAKPPLATPAPASPFEVFMRLGLFPRGKPEPLSAAVLPTQAPTTVACLGM